MFQEISPQELCEFALVCKAWLIPAQSVLYTNVTIKSKPQLLLFYITVKHSPQLGRKVKILDIRFEVIGNYGVLEEVSDLYSNILPNVEELREYKSITYTPILKALSNSNLKYLRRLQPVNDDVFGDDLKNYVDCAYLMKDRLENVSLNDQLITADPGTKDFYNELSQFENLQEVEIELDSYNIIKVLEHVTEKCRILKNISFQFYGSRSHVQTIGTAEISKYAPNITVKSFWSYMVGYNDPKLLFYIVHKFVQLDNLDLQYATPNLIPLDISLFNRLLDFISGIKNVSLKGLSLDRKNAANFIGNFWGAFKDTKVGDCYISFDTEILKKGYEHATAVNMRYEESGLNFDWQYYMEFIGRGGKFIHDFKFHFKQDHSGICQMYGLPNSFIPYTLKHCTNLRKLHLQQCILKQINYEEISFTKKIALNIFSLKRCIIYDGIFEKMSELLTEVTQLKFDTVYYVHFVDEQSLRSINLVTEINMPNTRIDTVIIEGVYMVQSFYIKVLALANEKRCKYYRFDVLGFGRTTEFDSNEEEYNTLNNYSHMYLCCQTNPIIEFK